MGVSRFLAFALLAATTIGCGSSGSSPSGANDGTIAATMTITASGISPKAVNVPVGSRVTITNSDNRVHNMNSDPHPEHTDCPALNVGTLTAGQSRTSQNLTTIRSCGIHDHDNPDNALWKATITVQ